MLVTIDVVRTPRALRLMWRPGRLFSSRPAFVKAMPVARDWTGLDPRSVTIISAWDGDPGELRPRSAKGEHWRGLFEVQRSHGALGGADPLGGEAPSRPTGPGVIWTCGNVRARRLPAFLRQNLRVVRELETSAGFIQAFGAMGLWRRGPWMCTFSLWDDLEAGVAAAYKGSQRHRQAIDSMRSDAYGTRETYFARLRLLASHGTMGGRDPFAAVVDAAA